MITCDNISALRQTGDPAPPGGVSAVRLALAAASAPQPLPLSGGTASDGNALDQDAVDLQGGDVSLFRCARRLLGGLRIARPARSGRFSRGMACAILLPLWSRTGIARDLYPRWERLPQPDENPDQRRKLEEEAAKAPPATPPIGNPDSSTAGQLERRPG